MNIALQLYDLIYDPSCFSYLYREKKKSLGSGTPGMVAFSMSADTDHFSFS